MNEQAQRIAIAEFCGWKIINGHSVISPEGHHYDFMRWEAVVPDYLNDLNAIHEAEKLILAQDPEVRSRWFIFMQATDYTGIHATAKVRSEAVLRTIGEWSDQ